MTTQKERIAAARIRAMSQVSHFAATSSTATPSETICERCRKPLNRWDEECSYDKTIWTLLAEDVLYLIDLVQAQP